MADSYFKPPDSERRVLRNSNITGLSAINRNGEFKVPRVPSRYATQTLCSNVPPQPNVEPSVLQFMKSIGDKLEVVEKLKIIPMEDVKQLSTEYLQKLDSLCMEKIARHLQTTSNPTPTVVNDNGSVFHTIISNAVTIQPSVRSCACQASTCGSEMGYSARKEIVPKVVPTLLKPIPESSKQTKPSRVLPSDDENESVVSFFKKNQSRSQNTKSTVKKPVTSTTNVTSRRKTEASVTRKTTKQPRAAVNRRSLSADSRVAEPKSKRVNKQNQDDSESTIVGPSKRKRAVPSAQGNTKNSQTNHRRSRSVDSRQVEPETKKTASKKRTKENTNLPLQPKKRKSAKNSSEVKNDVNITRNSLRDTKESQRVIYSVTEVTIVIPKLTLLANENPRNACGYDQTDREFFGNVSAITGESFQFSPNNVMKNMTKMSSNRNDLPLHFFSPFANTRSISGVSAVSTPLSKTIAKRNLNNRLKKPDRLAELKAAKPLAIAKRKVKNDVASLNASEDSENSSFSDYENSDEY